MEQGAWLSGCGDCISATAEAGLLSWGRVTSMQQGGYQGVARNAAGAVGGQEHRGHADVPCGLRMAQRQAAVDCLGCPRRQLGHACKQRHPTSPPSPCVAWRCAVDACVPVQGWLAVLRLWPLPGLLLPPRLQPHRCPTASWQLSVSEGPICRASGCLLAAEALAAPHRAPRKQSGLHLVGQPDGRRPGLHPRPQTLGCSPAVPATGPGAMPFTRMPKAPHSSASVLVRLSTAALAAEACACTCSRCHFLNDCRVLWSFL